jgi:hypothetical protein
MVTMSQKYSERIDESIDDANCRVLAYIFIDGRREQG